MGGTGMQRSNSSTVRMAMAVCLGALVLITFLYLMKRVEVNRTSRELELVKIETRNTEEGLNTKIVQYVEKIESLSQEVVVVSGRFKKCQDEKAIAAQQKSQAESASGKCSAELVTVKNQLAQANTQLQEVTEEKENAAQEKSDEMEELKQDNVNLQRQFDQCEADAEKLRKNVDMLTIQKNEQKSCSAMLVNAQQDLREAQAQVSALKVEIKEEKQSAKNSLKERAMFPSPTAGNFIRHAPLDARLPPSVRLPKYSQAAEDKESLDLGEAGKELSFSDEDEDGDHDQFEMDQKSDNEENDDPSF